MNHLKFLKSTPGFPRELKMGIFGGSETGKFWKGANCDNSDRREGGEGVTLQLGAGNPLIYCHWYVAMILPFYHEYWHWMTNFKKVEMLN